MTHQRSRDLDSEPGDDPTLDTLDGSVTQLFSSFESVMTQQRHKFDTFFLHRRFYPTPLHLTAVELIPPSFESTCPGSHHPRRRAQQLSKTATFGQ